MNHVYEYGISDVNIDIDIVLSGPEAKVGPGGRKRTKTYMIDDASTAALELALHLFRFVSWPTRNSEEGLSLDGLRSGKNIWMAS